MKEKWFYDKIESSQKNFYFWPKEIHTDEH